MAIKSFKEFQSEFNLAIKEKHKQELKFRDEHKAGEQERVVSNILNSLERQIKDRIDEASVEPVSAWEYSHPIDCVTSSDVIETVSRALFQIEAELTKAGYKFEADIQKSGQGYKLAVIVILAPEIDDEYNKLIEQEAIKLSTVDSLLCFSMFD